MPANVTAKLPLTDLTCYQLDPAQIHPTTLLSGGASGLTSALDPSDCPHNGYATPEVDTVTRRRDRP